MRIYALLITPPPVNKFYTREQGQLLYDFIRYTILTPLNMATQSKVYRNGAPVLMQALRRNESTDFGTHYGFSSLHSIAEYKKKVPIYNYRDYNRLVELSTTVGESQLITKEPIGAYAATFGFNKKAAYIPMAQSLCSSLGKSFLHSFDGEKAFLLVGSMPKITTENDGAYEDSLTNIILRSGMGALSLGDVSQAQVFSSPPEVFFAQESGQTYYLNLLLALRNENVTQIYASNSWLLINFIRMLQTFAEDLCRDIAEGTISHGDAATRQLGEHFTSFLRKKPDRANQIREALKKDKEDILLAIWPKLKKIVARNGANYHIYTRQFEPWCKKVPLVSGEFYTSFGIIGHSLDQANVYELATENAFYEFLPVNEVQHPSPVLRTDLKPGHIYELIVTNEYGIYRLATNIFIRPLEITDTGLRFEEVMHPLKVKGVPVLTGEDLESALFDVLDGQLKDFYYFYDMKNRCLCVICAASQVPSGNLGDLLTKKLRAKLMPGAEEILKDVSVCRIILTDDKNILKTLMQLYKFYRVAADGYRPEHYIVDIESLEKLCSDMDKSDLSSSDNGKGTREP